MAAGLPVATALMTSGLAIAPANAPTMKRGATRARFAQAGGKEASAPYWGGKPDGINLVATEGMFPMQH